jgi:hypothetical protein
MDTANFKITVKGIVNFTGTNAVYLHDKTTDLYHDIKKIVLRFNIAWE